MGLPSCRHLDSESESCCIVFTPHLLPFLPNLHHGIDHGPTTYRTLHPQYHDATEARIHLVPILPLAFSLCPSRWSMSLPCIRPSGSLMSLMALPSLNSTAPPWEPSILFKPNYHHSPDPTWTFSPPSSAQALSASLTGTPILFLKFYPPRFNSKTTESSRPGVANLLWVRVGNPI